MKRTLRHRADWPTQSVVVFTFDAERLMLEGRESDGIRSYVGLGFSASGIQFSASGIQFSLTVCLNTHCVFSTGLTAPWLPVTISFIASEISFQMMVSAALPPRPSITEYCRRAQSLLLVRVFDV